MSRAIVPRNLRFRVSEEMYQALCEAAKASGRPLSELVRRAIAAQLAAVAEREKAALEVLP